MSFISVPMGHVLSWISSLVGNNFAAAVCIFTILVNILMLPLTMKSQKSTVQQTRIKVDNMREEHEERLFNSEQVAAARAKEIEKEEKAKAKDEPKKPCAFISVSAGDGLSELFKELGVDVVITGGQTMNPSTDDMLEAIKEANAENVFIFPNNKNIILTANQARDITEDCKVFVIPTKTIPQGISAVIGSVPEKSPEDNASDMTECATAVKSC